MKICCKIKKWTRWIGRKSQSYLLDIRAKRQSREKCEKNLKKNLNDQFQLIWIKTSWKGELAAGREIINKLILGSLQNERTWISRMKRISECPEQRVRKHPQPRQIRIQDKQFPKLSERREKGCVIKENRNLNGCSFLKETLEAWR